LLAQIGEHLCKLTEVSLKRKDVTGPIRYLSHSYALL